MNAPLILALFFVAPADPVLDLAALPATPAGSRRVYFVRHGQALSNLRPQPQVANLDTLTDLGRSQARATASALRAAGVAGVVTSPAGRARETGAEMVGVFANATAATADERLRPLDLGRHEDGRALTFEERGRQWSDGLDPAVTGGERMADVGERLAKFACDFKGAGAAAPVVAVSHSETIQAFVVFAMKAPAWTAWPPRIANGSVTVAECDPAGTVKVLGVGLPVK